MTSGPAPVPPPLRLRAPEPPDADYAALRSRAVAAVTALAGQSWTDHNASDPGITLLEVLAWGLADLHYRTARRGLDGWPSAAPVGRTDGRRGWSTASLPDDVGTLATVARALAAPTPGRADALAHELAPQVELAPDPPTALGLVLDATAAAGHPLDAAAARVAVGLLRRRVVARVALDLSGRFPDALVEARRALGAGAADADVGARVRTTLRLDPAARPLWDDELDALLERHRRRTAEPRAVGLGAPEDDERADGTTLVWPPTAVQALSCEPVTAEDYASRARAVRGVRRAWAVLGALPGTAWHGGPSEAGSAQGALTLLVERAPAPPEEAPESDETLLRRVLREAVGEVDDPFDLLERTDPRRLLGDAVGAAVLRTCPVVLTGTLHVVAGADRAAVVAACRSRVTAFLAAGRPEHRRGSTHRPLGGPWPWTPQPAGGWVPGAPVPVAELVQAMADDPVVLGVSGVRVAVDGAAPEPAEGVTVADVPVPAGCLPVLAAGDCLRVRPAAGEDSP